MRTIPEEVSIGDFLSQEEIEEVFDTGFGYRISGINPRRDSQDQRYVLVFANEDGPYDDSVTQGRFEYVGEGLEGDQSESSPGNSTLIDAISSTIPVHFFYQQSGDGEWEYQGLVDILDYNFKEQGGREVIVFKMEHRDGPPEDDDLCWLDAMRLELERYQEQKDENVATLGELYDFSEHRLSIQFPDNNHVRAKIRQQLQRLRDQDEVNFLDEQGTYRINVGDEVKQEKGELEQTLDSEPQLTEDSTEFTESRRRARDHAFAELVKDAYDYSCAICGSRRETPAGNPEVEAAHIYPKREGGSDDVRNGLTLCKLHHWAFDTGWLAISDEHEILVKDAPNRDAYYEFKQLEGDLIRLPGRDDAEPHPIFLREHRQLNEF
ncbi:HNH endonuclease [Natrarchaeobius sp. A-rgal3]|uniref:HNH endonuclease n=1 Tax=Natrarchaeobius versutus TaxID=1679078 RepID=UPI00350ECC5F